MAVKPSKEVKDEPGAEERFERGVANALNTPHKPQKEKAPKPPSRDD